MSVPQVAEPVPQEAPAVEEADFLDRFVDRLFSNVDFLQEHPALQALLILVGALVLARLLSWFVTRVLRNLAARTRLAIDDRLVSWLPGPLIRSTIVIGLAVAVRVLQLEPPWDDFTHHALLTLAAFVWAPFAFRATSLLLRTASQDERRFKTIEPRTYPLFNNFAKLLLFVGLVYVVIQIWDADPRGLLASAGILGIAIGFAAQDTLGNLFAGVFIIADAPYQVGDYITLDTGERGRVLNIGLRSTRLLTRDDIEITVPNAIMGQAKIINEAGGPSIKHRIHVPVSVAYGSDIDQVRQALVAVAQEEGRISKTPEPRVRFRSFGNSGLEFVLLVWISEPWMKGQILDALNTAVYKRFAADEIEIPYPKRDVYVRSLPTPLDDPGGGA